jgi:hypothetical protein
MKIPTGLWVALFLLASPGAWARDDEPLAAPEKDPSGTRETSIETWQPKGPVRPPPPPPDPVVPPPASVEKPPKKEAEPKRPSKKEAAKQKAAEAAAEEVKEAPRPMNSMTGTVSSMDVSEKSLRISVEGGFTPQFNFDKQTIVLRNGAAVPFDTLQTGDKVIVRYIGRDMTAREIEKMSR